MKLKHDKKVLLTHFIFPFSFFLVLLISIATTSMFFPLKFSDAQGWGFEHLIKPFFLLIAVKYSIFRLPMFTSLGLKPNSSFPLVIFYTIFIIIGSLVLKSAIEYKSAEVVSIESLTELRQHQSVKYFEIEEKLINTGVNKLYFKHYSTFGRGGETPALLVYLKTIFKADKSGELVIINSGGKYYFKTNKPSFKDVRETLKVAYGNLTKVQNINIKEVQFLSKQSVNTQGLTQVDIENNFNFLVTHDPLCCSSEFSVSSDPNESSPFLYFLFFVIFTLLNLIPIISLFRDVNKKVLNDLMHEKSYINRVLFSDYQMSKIV